jgi:hypothetical protein
MQLAEHIEAWRRKRDGYLRHIAQLERVIRGQRAQLRQWQHRAGAESAAAKIDRLSAEVRAKNQYITQLERDLVRERTRNWNEPAKREAIIEIRTMLATHGYHDAHDRVREWYPDVV